MEQYYNSQELAAAIRRYAGYGWRTNLIRKTVNRYFGTSFTTVGMELALRLLIPGYEG